VKPLIAIALLTSVLASAEQPVPVYPGTVHTRIGNDLLIGGEYYRLAYFHSGDSLKQVARYFQKQWTDEGYPVTVDGDFKEEGVVSAFYTREGLIRSVVLKQHDGKTLGFTVLKDVWVHEPLARAVKLPPIEGTLFSEDIVLRDESGGTQARSSLLEGSLDQAREKLVRSFTDKGYVIIRDTRVKLDGKSQRVLEFSRGKEQAVVSMVEVQPRVVAVQQTWVGSDRPDAVPNDEAVKAARERSEKSARTVKSGAAP
jgi:hypothetical protein